MFPVMVFWGKGRQMENTDTTDTAKDWRHAWRAFADKVNVRPPEFHNGATSVLSPQLQEVREGSFEGFNSPPGKF